MSADKSTDIHIATFPFKKGKEIFVEISQIHKRHDLKDIKVWHENI